MAAKLEEENQKVKTTRDLIWDCFKQVTADGNLGTWLNNIYGDHDKFEKVLSRVVMDRPHEGFPSPVSVEPISTVNEFVVELRQLDYSQHAKHGYFPHMATLAVHFKSILYQGFDPYREPLNLRFVSQGDRSIPSFSVRYVDGFSKGLICQSIAAIVDFLGIPDEELESDDLLPLLQSIRFLKARYTHLDNQEGYFYEALRLGQETAEKQLPSALDYVGIFQQAVQAYKQGNGRKVAPQVALNSCIAEYNKGIKVKKYRVDTLKRKLITNLLKVPPESLNILALHYDLHRHSSSGRLTFTS
ncbi:Uncharacterized protein SCF082_LOCUS21371 [Durusdinium trenchii]|uniref:Uncharacterized protein n=1 Tax=Durusdinium trenchii TaxID=1381693 RepID=A0ABP0L900_9DINO